MQSALKTTATVQPGGRVEITDAQLPAGEAVDIVILFYPAGAARRSVRDVLAEAPGQLAFHTAAEVDTYLREERDAWDR
ncbi:MAG: hypothetical protein JO250_10025 [Armatimonadetes bacterium]|nr:hypothetical protein [Armatimonadota bacterium]